MNKQQTRYKQQKNRDNNTECNQFFDGVRKYLGSLPRRGNIKTGYLRISKNFFRRAA